MASCCESVSYAFPLYESYRIPVKRRAATKYDQGDKAVPRGALLFVLASIA